MIVSSSGFTADVLERAKLARYLTLTYDEFFRTFERFEPYLQLIHTSPLLTNLLAHYEEPFFEDQHGRQIATRFLDSWRDGDRATGRWLVILGDYGTGKTALTQILQYRWLQDYKADPSLPLPIRLEPKNFTKQFDYRSLLHYFLDSSGISHIPVEFLVALIRRGKALLLLDGYDEMAQFMNVRERRACMATLAQLAADGARGILTSRPNFFTEEEEFQVFEVLYAMLKSKSYQLSKSDLDFFQQERSTDTLITQLLLDRYERHLRDLEENEVKSLVSKRLKDNAEARKVVLEIIHKVFRQTADGSYTSLGGKPVIVSYLLELVSEPSEVAEIGEDAAAVGSGSLSEFDIYKIIVDRLMVRDQRRSLVVFADRRRRFLQQLAVILSRQETPVAVEETFRDLINVEFATELRRHTSGDREEEVRRYFSDLRSSATLTSDETKGRNAWRFSHNSLREFLVVEAALRMLEHHRLERAAFPVTSAMRAFATSMGTERIREVERDLREVWDVLRKGQADLGVLFVMFWDGLLRIHDGDGEKVIQSLTRGSMDMSGLRIQDWILALRPGKVKISGISFRESELSSVSFAGLAIEKSDFSHSTLDAVDFTEATLTDVSLSNCWLVDSVFVGTTLENVDFRGLDRESILTARVGGVLKRLSSDEAIGFLRFHGATTDDVDEYYVLQNHSNFSIVEKIVDRLVSQAKSQYRGLTQRGEAHANPIFARDFVSFLEKEKIVTIDAHRLVGPTAYGRNVLAAFKERKMPEGFSRFLSRG
jgi:hypothetical protein